MPKAAPNKNKQQNKKNLEELKESGLCPIHRLVSLLTGPWTTYILWSIQSNKGSLRFGELKKAMPKISAKVLTERLRMLESEEILTRFQEETIPPKVTYSLTKRGKELSFLLDEINRLAKKWYDKKTAKK
jgi:DNA-binding HxlR family transcriptional regulator